MIIYATKKTVEKYKLKQPSELPAPINILAENVIKEESGNKLLEWGAKLFFFDRRKCLQLVNFSSKLTLFLVNIKMADLGNIGNMMSYHLLELYKTDKEMTKTLTKMFEAHPIVCFDKLTDKSAIATLNTTQSQFAADGYHFYNFIREGVLHTLEINHKVNFNWIFTMKINGKKEYIYAGEIFRKSVMNQYGK